MKNQNVRVTTISGKSVLKKNARKILSLDGTHKYYEIGNVNIKDSGDCFKIGKFYYTLEKGRIEWDYYNNCYQLKSKLIKGYIDNELKEGYFDATCNYIYIINKTSKTPCLSNVFVKESDYIIKNNEYYSKSCYSLRDVYPRVQIDNNYKALYPYTSKDSMSEAINNYENFTYDKDNSVEFIYKLLKNVINNYTVGIEIETTAGLIPKEEVDRLGLIPLRDGSISGIEYVTVPISGKKGLYLLKEFIDVINKYTDFNYTCSMHIHIGGVPRSEQFITSLFKLANILETDIYRTFPGYKMVNNGIKKQCYTAPLNKQLLGSLGTLKTDSEINKAFKKICYILTSKHEEYKISRTYSIEDITNHPADPSERSKWHMRERYKWLNIIPLIFTNKSTIEYRIFTVPDNYMKALLFLSISLIITDFANNQSNLINEDNSILTNWDLKRVMSTVLNSSLLNAIYDDRVRAVDDLKLNTGDFFEEVDVKTEDLIRSLSKYGFLI